MEKVQYSTSEPASKHELDLLAAFRLLPDEARTMMLNLTQSYATRLLEIEELGPDCIECEQKTRVRETLI